MSDIVRNPFYEADFTPMNHKNNQQDYFISDAIAIGKGAVDLIGKIKKKDPKKYAQKGVDAAAGIALMAAKNRPIPEIRQFYEGAKRTKNSYWDRTFGGMDQKAIFKKAIQLMNQTLAEIGEAPISESEFLSQMNGSQAVAPVASQTTTIAAPNFDILRPLVPTMQRALQAKGIPASNRLDVLAQQFYNTIVVPNMGFNFDKSYKLSTLDMFDVTPDHADEVKDAIITGIITYIQNLQRKKETGEQLNKTENLIVSGTESVQQTATEGAKGYAAEEFGKKFLFGGGWIWLIAAVVGIVFVIIAARK